MDLLQEQFLQPQVRDFPLLLGSDVHFDGWIVVQTVAQQAEHLRGGLARGANDENMIEPRLVFTVRCDQLSESLRIRAARSGLLLLGPATTLLADPRMGGEGLSPILTIKASPDRIGFFPQIGEILKRTPLHHLLSPGVGAATRQQHRHSLFERQGVEVIEIHAHRGSPAKAPKSRRRATPPSGKMLSRTWVIGPVS